MQTREQRVGVACTGDVRGCLALGQMESKLASGLMNTSD